ncbi:hypothetical protein BOTBODRAFT_89523, partial [Botryobasidium botryosum FD-172 SS1]
IVHSYDVNCQYCRKIRTRFEKHFPDIDINTVKFVIPKWHASAHKEDCQFLYSLYFTPGVGCLDGEAPERNWAILNLVSTSAREMNTAHQHELLEDHMNDINFGHMIALGTFFLS